MGRIIGYQYDNDIKDDDAWIGTEATSRRTKQYTAQAVADYLNINGSISIVGQMSYKYSTTPLNGIGTFAVFGGGPNTVAFSAITKLTLSNQDISEQRVVEYLDLLVGSDMIISESGQISTFGYYSIDGYVVNATNSDYYDLSVTFKSGNGAMEADKVYETQNFTLAAEENISTLQTTIDSGNTYQASPSGPLWTWGSGEITTTTTSFTSLLSGKRFKTTLIADGSYTDVIPNQINFNTATGNVTSITTNTALSSNIDLQLPSSSGTLALTSDITDSPWDTVSEGINYAGGNVGIGATTPIHKLEVAGGNVHFENEEGSNTFLDVKGVDANAYIRAYSGSQSLWLYQGGSSSYLQAQTGSTLRLGSGTSNLVITNTSGEVMRISGSNVGIGTTNPSEDLDVAGTIRGEAVFIKNIGGYNAKLLSDSLTTNKTFEFPDANGTIALTSDIPAASQWDDVTGGINYASGNVGIGTTSPSEKLEVAGRISISNTGKSVFLGDRAGENDDFSDNSNIAIGQQSLRANILGIENVAIGASSLLSSTANRNTAVGVETLRRNSTGTNNTALGYRAMYYNQTGGSNVALGFSALWRLTSGLKNVVIGDQSGIYTSTGNLTVANDSIFIGAGAKALGDNQTNQVVIGKLAQGLGSNTVVLGNSSVVTTQLQGNVGIGTTSPGQKLQVSGNILATGNITAYGGASDSSVLSALGTLQLRNSGNTNVNIQSTGNSYFNGGNVGIGTTSPSTNLEVVTSDPANGIKGTTNTGIIWGSFINTNSNSFPVGKITLRYGATETVSILARSNEMRLGNSQTQMSFYASSSEKMRIHSNGNVGIGTTSPQHVLDVADSGINSTAPTIRLTNTANYNAGAWGGNTSHSIEFYSSDPSGSRVASAIENIAGIDKGGLLTGNLVFKTSDYPTPGTLTEKMRIAEDGNVGIGTTSPTSKLDVAGGDIELDDVAAGIIMKSPDGTKYRITVANGGTLTVTAV